MPNITAPMTSPILRRSGMVAEDSGAGEVAGMSSRSRALAATALLVAAACSGGEAAPPRPRATAATARPVSRPALPAVIDSAMAESLAVDSALRGIADPGHALFGCFIGDSA